MEIIQIIAENLKKLRTERNYSLGQLSELTGVSKVMLSQIEKADTNPTINTLWKIAGGLKIPYTTLLEKQKQANLVVRKQDLPVQRDENQHYRIFCFYPSSAQRNFELFQLELDAGHSHTSIGHLPKSQEFIMVIEGTLHLTTDGETHTLNADDALCFSASSEHHYHASGSDMLKAIIINFYPQ